jgi:hypothetical protein
MGIKHNMLTTSPFTVGRKLAFLVFGSKKAFGFGFAGQLS